MNISWQWLNELINLKNIKPQDLVIKLTLAGFEVDNIITTSKQDTILDVNISANRSDTMYLIGIAREISAILKQPLLRISNQDNIKIKYKAIDKNNNDYLYGYLTSVKIKSSPEWLRYKLKCYGIESQNNLTDIIKFIEIKWGQSFDIFDMDKINTCIKTTPIEQNFPYSMSLKKDTIILVKNQPIIINIQENEKNIHKWQEIDTNTENISIQTSVSCNFNYKESFPISGIKIQTSISNNQLREKFDILNAYSEMILLIQYLCEGKIQNTLYITNPQKVYQPFIFNENYINNILGFVNQSNSISIINQTKMHKQEIIKILNNLNFLVDDKQTNWRIQIPQYRSQDLIRDIDIIEEIGRTYGFDKFIDIIPPYYKKGNRSKQYLKINQIKSILRNIGFTESIHYSFVKIQTNHLGIHNPLNEDYKYLRNNIIQNILIANHNNIKQGNEPIEIFEIGRIFQKINSVYQEDINLAGILGGQQQCRSEWSQKPTPLTWFQAKGELEELFERLQVNITWKKIDNNYSLLKKIKHLFHPNRIVSIYIENQPIGIFGQLDLRICKEYNFRECTYGFEIEINYIINTQNKHFYYFKNYSKYPYITRDITVSTKKLVEISTLLNKVKNKLNPLVESISIFDFYSTKKNNKVINNLGLRVKYRSMTNTLTHDMVDNLHKQVEISIKESL